MSQSNLLPATRTTALSAGSSTESWLLRLRLSCLDRFHGRVSPLDPAVLWAQGEREPPDLSLRNERSLTHERSLRLSSSEEDISPGPGRRDMRGGRVKRETEIRSGQKQKHVRDSIMCQISNSSPTGQHTTTIYQKTRVPNKARFMRTHQLNTLQ